MVSQLMDQVSSLKLERVRAMVHRELRGMPRTTMLLLWSSLRHCTRHQCVTAGLVMQCEDFLGACTYLYANAVAHGYG